MRLSVIVPVYNMAAEGKLNFCMDSLVNQTFQDLEIIAVDDASTDNSLEILRQYEKQYPEKVKVLTYPVNRRQGGAKNEGLKAAGGEWIGFVDSDDWVAPECYEKLLGRAEETGADVVGCDYSLVTEHTFEVGRVIRNNEEDQVGPLDERRHKRLILRPGSMVVKIYKHSVIRENGLCFPENIFYEDNCAGPLWSMYFTRFERVEEPLYYYYQHDSSTVHRVTEERCRDRVQAEEVFLKECEKRGFLEKYREEIEYRYVELSYVITVFSYLQGAKHPKLSFVKELRQKAQEHWPDFRENSYYQSYSGMEEKRFLAMQAESDLKFYLYYRWKLWVRRLISDFSH